MRPRAIHTQKLLVIALTAVAGCSERSPEARSEPPAPASAAPLAAETPVATSPASARPTSNERLVTLREELFASQREDALAKVAHYRPLCDAQGYPLVGNVIRKAPGYQPSAFCQDVREGGRR